MEEQVTKDWGKEVIALLPKLDEEQSKALVLAFVLSLKSFKGRMTPEIALEWLYNASQKLIELKVLHDIKPAIIQPEKPKLIL